MLTGYRDSHVLEERFEKNLFVVESFEGGNCIPNQSEDNQEVGPTRINLLCHVLTAMNLRTCRGISRICISQGVGIIRREA
jgi:hypothetical protein